MFSNGKNVKSELIDRVFKTYQNGLIFLILIEEENINGILSESISSMEPYIGYPENS